MIRVNNAKLFLENNHVLLQNMNFSISKGKLNYFFGPNGIGKTSLVKAILDISFKIDRIDKNFDSFFYLPQVQNKEFLLPCRLQDISSQGVLLQDHERKLFWNIASGGQRKKALIERAFAAICDLYVFDEPYNHLDKNTITIFNTQVEKMLNNNKTVIMIGHERPHIDENLIVNWDVSQWT